MSMNEMHGLWNNGYIPHPVKNKGSIIGAKGKNTVKPMKRSKIRAVSPKQRARTKALKEKFKIIATEHVRLYGSPMCERGRAGLAIRACYGDLVVDHVRTRNENKADDYINLQFLCFGCNTAKGSERIDFRDDAMIRAMRKLDESERQRVVKSQEADADTESNA
jgi:hypothetical protein